MKKSLLFIAAGCLALSSVSHAGNEGLANEKSSSRKTVVPDRVVQKSDPRRVVIYIADRPRTGSNIPMTYRRYNGRLDSASNAAVYGSSALQATGAFDAGTMLYRLDPSISFRR